MTYTEDMTINNEIITTEIQFKNYFKSLSTKAKSKFCKDNKIEVECNNSKNGWRKLNRKELLEEICNYISMNEDNDKIWWKPKYALECYL